MSALLFAAVVVALIVASAAYSGSETGSYCISRLRLDADGVVQGRITTEPRARVCLQTDGQPSLLQCRDVGGAQASVATSFELPVANAEFHWYGGDVMLFAPDGDYAVQIWRAEPSGRAVTWLCTMEDRDDRWSADYWSVTPTAPGLWAVRWNEHVEFFIDANCTVVAAISTLRDDAEATLALVDAAGPSLCIDERLVAPRPHHTHGVPAWGIVGIVMALVCCCGAAVAAVCMVRPGHSWRLFFGHSFHAKTDWSRLRTARLGRLGLICPYSAQESIYSLALCLCPCIAGRINALVQRVWAPAVYRAAELDDTATADGVAPPPPGLVGVVDPADTGTVRDANARWADVSLHDEAMVRAAQAAAGDDDDGDDSDDDDCVTR